jgi:hypothetical protein
MKSIIIIGLMLSALFSYGQKKQSGSVADPVASRLNLWIDKVDHLYVWQCEQRDILWKLSRRVDSLITRIEALENRPQPFFKIDSSGHFWTNLINTFVTGTAILDTAAKKKP